MGLRPITAKTITFVLLNDNKLNNYPGGGNLIQSPEGTAEHRSTGFQPSLTGLDLLHPVYPELRPGLFSAILSRPFGTLGGIFPLPASHWIRSK